jgi:hypothetical protein
MIGRRCIYFKQPTWSVTESKVMHVPVSCWQTGRLDGLFGTLPPEASAFNYLSIIGINRESAGLETSKVIRRLHKAIKDRET